MLIGTIVVLPFYYFVPHKVASYNTNVYGIIVSIVNNSLQHLGEYELYLPHNNRIEIFYSCEFEIISNSCA